MAIENKLIKIDYNNFNQGSMPKIRKQPKRSIKKLRLPSLKNPFSTELSHIPDSIAQKISVLSDIAPTHLDELIS